MEKKDLVNILSEMLVPIGFKRKGNNWVINGNTMTKIINLQKSQFGNVFYINYGYILKALPLGIFKTHVENRVVFSTIDENLRFYKLLDLENNISDEERIKQLKDVLQNKLVLKIQSVNTEEDLLKDLKMRSHLNDIPLVVKKYFNLE